MDTAGIALAFQSYFRNHLSIAQLSQSLENAGAAVEAITISDMLERKFGYVPAYTATSGTFIARKQGGS